jgi:hypothetical protein
MQKKVYFCKKISMSTTAFLKNYDSFPEKIKEDLSIIAEYLLFSYYRKSENLATPSEKKMSEAEFIALVENSAKQADEGKVISTEQARELIKTWRKK